MRQAVIQRLNDELAAAPTAAAVETKDTQIKLQQAELSKLRTQLEHAKMVGERKNKDSHAKYHTPTMQHYDLLQAKIQDLEARLAQVCVFSILTLTTQRDLQLQRALRDGDQTHAIEMEMIETKWRKQLLAKVLLMLWPYMADTGNCRIPCGN